MDVVGWTMHASQIHVYPELQDVTFGNWVFANLLVNMKSYQIKVEPKPSGFITGENTQRNTERRGHVKSNPICGCGTQTSLMAPMVKRLSKMWRPGFDPWVRKIP